MRRFESGDESSIFEYASDPEVTRYMDWPAHERIADSVAYIEMTDLGWASEQQFAWAITIGQNSKPIGAIGCSDITHKVSFGYVLSRSAWGKGYATEASRALLGWLEEATDVQRIWALCDIGNVASANVLRKLGMEKEGVLKKWKIRPNLPGKPARDSLMFSKIVGS